jgi:hypothetical protein
MSDQRPEDDAEGHGKLHGAVEPAGDEDTEGNLAMTREQIAAGLTPAQAREEAARRMKEHANPPK